MHKVCEQTTQSPRVLRRQRYNTSILSAVRGVVHQEGPHRKVVYIGFRRKQRTVYDFSNKSY